MKRTLLFVSLFLFLLQKDSAAQNNSFYLDTLTNQFSYEAIFTPDAIYIFRGYCIKTDYTGNVIWSKSGFYYGISGIVVQDQFIFGIYRDSVYCLDTAGNFRWMKKFNSPVNPTAPYGNVFGRLAFDGKKIFVQVVQGGSWDEHRSVIVMDTSGSVLQVVCDSVFSVSDMHPYFAFPSLRGGAWLGYSDDNLNYSSVLLRVDENGQFDTTARKVPLNFQGETTIRKMIATPDSNYVIVTNSLWAGNYYQNYFTCTKIDEGGNVLWQSSYYDTTYSWSMVDYRANDVTCDALGNIYIVGTFFEATPWTIPIVNMIVKLDSAGNIEFVKGWKNPLNILNHPKNCHYRNGMVYCLSDSQSVTGMHRTLISEFNDQFTGNCFPTDTIMHLDKIAANAITGQLYTGNLSLLSYTPADDTLLIVQSVASTEPACIISSVSDHTYENTLIVSPVPASASIKISSGLKLTHIRIFNAFGQIVFNEHIKQQEVEIPLDVSHLLNGIYFLSALNDEYEWNAKVIISH